MITYFGKIRCKRDWHEFDSLYGHPNGHLFAGMEGSYDTRAPEVLSSYHRKRSNSLPRILPPILDDDDDEQEMVVPEGHRRDQVRKKTIYHLTVISCLLNSFLIHSVSPSLINLKEIFCPC